MGFFYRPAGGGAGNVLTVPTGTVTLNSETFRYNINLQNVGTTPASVELSFQNSRLKGLDPDSGTESSPSYVVDPDEGSRLITIERTTLAASSLEETVSFTGNAGGVQFLNFTLEPQYLHTYAQQVAGVQPIYEYKFAGNFTDTGSRDVGDLTLTGTPTPTAVSSTSDLTGVVGYTDFTTAGQTAKIDIAGQDINWKTGQPRSVLWVGKLNDVPVRIGYLIGTSATDGPVYLRYYNGVWTSASSYTFTYDTTQSHTDGGASVAMATTANTEIAMLYSHDGGTSLTVRWKTLNGNTERTGHSFKTVTQVGKSTINRPLVLGWTTLLSDIRHRHMSIHDYAFTESDFSDFCTILGFGA